jgi:hypothetical protein
LSLHVTLRGNYAFHLKMKGSWLTKVMFKFILYFTKIVSTYYLVAPENNFWIDGTNTASRNKIKQSRYRHAGAKGERKCSSYSLFIWTLEGGEWSASRPAALCPRERTAATHWTGGWVGLRAGLNTEARGKILFLCTGPNHGRPVCSQTLYWLSYPSSPRGYTGLRNNDSLMMEATSSSETLTSTYNTTRRRNSEDHLQHLHRCENYRHVVNMFRFLIFLLVKFYNTHV